MGFHRGNARSLLAAVVVAGGLLIAYSWFAEDEVSAVRGGPASVSPLEASSTAPWKRPLEGREEVEASLDGFRYREGIWMTEETVGEGEGRHRIRIEYESTLDDQLLTSRSYDVYPDRAENLYLEENFFLNASRPSVVPTYLFFDSGLYADATWIDDGNGVQRLDCDLYWPDGRKGRVRDLFVPVSPDTIRWYSYFEREGEIPTELHQVLTLVRQR